MANIPACLIGIEASSCAFYWLHEFEKLDHNVKVISPQYVKPFGRWQKNDDNDAQVIVVAMMQPTVQFVPPKSPEQQDIQALHRAKQRIVNYRTATVSQIRGLLLDRRITIGAAVSRVRLAVPLILEDAENGLSVRMCRTIAKLYDFFNDLGRRINFLIKKLMLCSGNQKPASALPKLKVLALKQQQLLLPRLAKELNLKMVVTLPHSLVWFQDGTRVVTSRY